MSDTKAEPKLVLPVLQPFYDVAIPLSWLLIRCAAGLILAVHGWPKLLNPAATAASMTKLGLQPAELLAYVLLIVEFFGGLCVAAGLFTRFFAAAAAIDLAVITFGVFWSAGYARYEFTLLWGIIMFAIALRGGGPYSIDRLLGREL